MATRAEVFRAQRAREANPSKAKRVRQRRDELVDTAQPGVSATSRKAGGQSTADRNRSSRAKGKGGARLEDSASGKPSRKSTRKSEGHVKRTANLQRRAIRRTSAPKARAERAKISKR
jgi:hypothetical protein